RGGEASQPVSLQPFAIKSCVEIATDSLVKGDHFVCPSLAALTGTRSGCSCSEIPGARKVWNWTRSFENTRSSVQSKATRNFFSKRGSLLRYMLRHNHQAMNPEKLTPRMLATPERRPMAAN